MGVRRYRPTTQRRPRWLAAPVVLVVAALAGACSATSTTATSSPTTSTTSTTTPAQATTAAILAGYRAEEDAFYAAANHDPANPFEPGLAATMTGAELVAVRDSLTLALHKGEYGVGRAELAPVVTGINGTGATISDCLFDHSQIVSVRTGQTISGPDTERTLEHITLQFVDGVWKVATYRKAMAGCRPGDV